MRLRIVLCRVARLADNSYAPNWENTLDKWEARLGRSRLFPFAMMLTTAERNAADRGEYRQVAGAIAEAER